MIDENNPFNSVIKEGGVTIKFSPVGNKVKLHFTVDFSKTRLSAHDAAQAMGKIVDTLRRELNVSLSEVKV